MRHRQGKAIAAQPSAKSFGNMDRPVPSTRAPKGDIYISLTLRVVERQQEPQKVSNFLHGFIIFRVGGNIIGNRRIQPRQGPQIAVPVRVS